MKHLPLADDTLRFHRFDARRAFSLKGRLWAVAVVLTVLCTALKVEAQSTNTKPDSAPYLDAAGSDPSATDAGPLDLEKELEHLGRVYKNDKNNTLQELWLLGRYHGQYHWTEANVGESDFYETRRFRLGAQAKMFQKMTLHAQMVSGSDIDPFYNGFTELWWQWAFSKKIALTIGQQKNRFTHDRNVSSRYLNYLERAMLTNMFAIDYTPAITLQGEVGNLVYYTGFFTNATGRDMGKSFTDFDSGYSYIAQAYYDLGKKAGFDDVTLYGSYIHSDFNQNATNMDYFENGVSTAIIAHVNKFATIAEVTGGFENENGNALGLNLQPSYFLNRQWQLVSRYQLAGSNGENGLKPQKRYEAASGFEPGDLYQAGYLGVNYYIAKHRLKLMQGLEYSNMSGQEGWTTSLMVRMYWGPHSGGAFPMNKILPLDYD
jgi:phosphate-selective porin OprO and OprP